jgi:glycosyltransferase involved in cell wall biosynthesis
LIVNEAMNAGRIIIATDQVGCGPDLVRPGENGFIYAAGDVGALSDALKEIVLMDEEARRSMGRRSLEIISVWNFQRDVAGLRNAILALRRER